MLNNLANVNTTGYKKSKIELGPITKTFLLLDGKKLMKTINYFDNIRREWG